MSGNASPRLTVSALTVAFGGLTALKNVSFTVEADETVALIGPNGAGKTTVFNAVCSLVRPKSGSISINGRPAPDSTSALLEQGVSRTLQGLGLFSGLTVLENVLVPLTSLRQRTAAAQTAAAMLERLSLGSYAQAPVDSLPYAMRKRVALARALVTNPSLLLLDEPAGGLSREDISDLADLVRSLRTQGNAVLLVEHHVDFVMEVADRVVVLDFGEVVAIGTPDEVRSDPAVEAAYLGLEAA
ncbi:ATP-binding cassette domain-containing protein [Nesterenkonia salmonea]|uniref:ATP-binding cassette domain-containing protein n=1 Tax=Nesterenkonia salmonea TaxID=1804987 RepID=A0A5R9BLU2_9MICC|nr:ATP-binding cassette domain-containing protein [Nesterenkonia salmonea]TLQ01083.1 ATP-binding cassette domain-containing protein [Nesterenkonia salmonea]